SITACPPVSVSSVRLSLTVMTAQRTFSGPWASCCLCVAVMCEPKVAVSGSSSLYFKMRQGQTADMHIVLGTQYLALHAPESVPRVSCHYRLFADVQRGLSLPLRLRSLFPAQQVPTFLFSNPAAASKANGSTAKS